MEVRAKAKYLHTSPRKIRLVVDAVRGLDVEVALDQLQFINKAATRPVTKLLNSAIANASHNHEIEKNNLYIKEVFVDQGSTLKRWRPRAFGRAAPIRKRTSHITIVLAEKEPTKKAAKKAKKELEKPTLVKDYKSVPKTEVAELEGKGKKEEEKGKKEESKEDKEKAVEKPESTKPEQVREAKQAPKKGFMKKIFSRKSF